MAKKRVTRSSEPTGPSKQDPQDTRDGPTKPSDAAKIWKARIVRESKAYDTWAKKYQVERLAQYYLGHHWRGHTETEASRKYTINLVFANVETQVPSLLFNKPTVAVEPRPGQALDPGSDVAARASLIESALQTEIDKPSLHFKFQTTLALRDAYARFGIVEVGYSADYLDNPNADKPVLIEQDRELRDGADQPVTQPKQVVKKGSETLFVKRIPPQSVRVSPGRNILEENDWVAAYEWQHVEDVKRNPAYKNTQTLKATGTVAAQQDDRHDTDPDRTTHTDMVRLWRIWDLRTNTQHVLADGHPTLLQEDQPFDVCPLAAIKFYEIADSWYPLPPLFNWISPQDELNEQREMQRNHRKRFVRRYLREASVTQAEFEKLETGDDGVCIEVGKVDPPPIVPIQDAELGQSNWSNLAATKEDYDQIAGVSGEAKGLPTADTATQANIINVRAQLRESSGRVQVGDWLAAIARLMLLTLRSKMTQPWMVKLQTDPFTPGAAAGQTAQTWREIQTEDIDELDVDVTVEMGSLSPVAEQAQTQSWNLVLQLLTDPARMTMLMTPNPEAPNDPSPLLRKTLMLNGVKREQEIREIWRVGQAALKQAADAAQAQQQSQVDQPKINYSFKGEDMTDPLVRLAFVRAEGLQAAAAALAAQAGPVPPSAGESPQGVSPVTAAGPGPTTGTPTPAGQPGVGG